MAGTNRNAEGAREHHRLAEASVGDPVEPDGKPGNPLMRAIKDQPIALNAAQARTLDIERRQAEGLVLGRKIQGEHQRRLSEALRQEFISIMRAEPTATIEAMTAQIKRRSQWYYNQRLQQPGFAEICDGIRRDAQIGPYNHGFEKWRWEFLGRQTYRHQKRLTDAIAKAKPRDRILMLFPPEAGKTTLLMEYIAYRIALDPDVRIQFMCKTPDEAKKRLGRIRAMLAEPMATQGHNQKPGLLIGAFGPFFERSDRLRPDTANYFTVARSSVAGHNYTLEARGVLSPIQGDRADVFIIDDPQDLQTLNNSEKILKKIRQEASSRLTQNGIMIWAATRVAPNDVYDLILNLDEDEWFLSHFLEERALRPVFDAAGAPTGEKVSYCPEMWPLDELAKSKQIVGPEAWSRCYMQEPLAAGARTFPTQNMEAAKDKHATVGQMESGMPGLLTIDPGLNPGVCAFLVSTIVGEEKLRLVEVTSSDQHAGINDLTSEMERMLVAYPGITDICVEANNFQSAIAQDDRFKALVAQYKLTVHEHKTGRNKNDADMGISALGKAYWRGEVVIPWASETEQRMFDPLIQQHIRWQPGVPDRQVKQDLVIVVWLAWKMLQEVRAALAMERKRDLNQWRRHQAAGWQRMEKVG